MKINQVTFVIKINILSKEQSSAESVGVVYKAEFNKQEPNMRRSRKTVGVNCIFRKTKKEDLIYVLVSFILEFIQSYLHSSYESCSLLLSPTNNTY